MNGEVEASVIIPTKDRLELLKETLDSLASQTLRSWEAIIVDDGSSDGTEAYVSNLSSSDARYRFFKRTGKRRGANVARNQGMAQAQASFILFLDSDDLLAPRCLERRVAFMKKNPALDFAIFRGEVFEEKIGDLDRLFAEDTGEDDLDRFLRLDYPWEITSPIWRKSYLMELKGFSEELLSWQDVDLHIRALADRAKYARAPETDHFIRWHHDPAKTSLKHSRVPSFLENAEAWTVRLEKLLVESGLFTWFRKRALAGLLFRLSTYWLELGEMMAAQRVWKRCRARLLISGWHYFPGMLAIVMLRYFDVSLSQRVVDKWRRELKLR